MQAKSISKLIAYVGIANATTFNITSLPLVITSFLFTFVVIDTSWS